MKIVANSKYWFLYIRDVHPHFSKRPFDDVCSVILQLFGIDFFFSYTLLNPPKYSNRIEYIHMYLCMWYNRLMSARNVKYIRFDRSIFSPAAWQLNGHVGGEGNNNDIIQVGRFE